MDSDAHVWCLRKTSGANGQGVRPELGLDSSVPGAPFMRIERLVGRLEDFFRALIVLFDSAHADA